MSIRTKRNADLLSDRINLATQSQHGRINPLVVGRLFQALPPYSTNPSKYVSGLLYIYPIFLQFENLWEAELGRACNNDNEAEQPPSFDSQDAWRSVAKYCCKLHIMLSDIYVEDLPRSQTIADEIELLSGIDNEALGEYTKEIVKHGKLSKYLEISKTSIEARPHVLLAYAWVLYMALFAGGRHLRSMLKKADTPTNKFWSRELSPIRPHFVIDPHQERPQSSLSNNEREGSDGRLSRTRTRPDGKDLSVSDLSFWHYPVDSNNGEQIQLEFKANFLKADKKLTEYEKVDVVNESIHVFEMLFGVVDDLVVVTQNPQAGDKEIERMLADNLKTLNADLKKVPSTAALTQRRLAGLEDIQNLLEDIQSMLRNGRGAARFWATATIVLIWGILMFVIFSYIEGME